MEKAKKRESPEYREAKIYVQGKTAVYVVDNPWSELDRRVLNILRDKSLLKEGVDQAVHIDFKDSDKAMGVLQLRAPERFTHFAESKAEFK